MPAEELENVLHQSDSIALHERLEKFVTSNEGFTPYDPADVATQYLRAFCDHQRPVTDRRWIGLALRKIIEAYPLFAEEVETGFRDFRQVGQVLLRNFEAEETRIVAGIVIREALKRGVNFASCWQSDKVPNSIPHFPQDDGISWMQEFQKFLDCFEDLKMVHPNTDPAILFPIAIIARDSYKWRHSDNIIPVALIQNGMLTIITPDQGMQDVGFLDIPLSHIEHTKVHKSSLHNSQAIETDREPWDLVLTFRPDKWTYRVNVMEHSGAELTILFRSSRDAEEANNCIWETKNKSSRPRMSSSKGVITIPSLNGTSERTSVGTQKFHRASESSAQAPKQHHRANRNDPLVIYSSEDQDEVLATQEVDDTVSPMRKKSTQADAAPRSGREQDLDNPAEAESSASNLKTLCGNIGLSSASATKLNARPTSENAAKGPKPRSSAPPLVRSGHGGQMSKTVLSETAQFHPGENSSFEQSHARNALSQPVDTSHSARVGEGKSSGLPKPSKPLKRRAAPTSEDALGDVWEIPSDTRSSVSRRQRKSVVQKVDYNETSSENSEDHSSVSDYVEPKPKKKKLSTTKSTSSRKAQSPRHAKNRVTKRKTNDKRTVVTKQQQTFSPEKHGIINSLVSSAHPTQKTGHRRASGEAHRGNGEKHRRASSSMERAETETPSAHAMTAVSSEAHILSALTDGEPAADDDVHHPSPARSRVRKIVPGTSNGMSHDPIIKAPTSAISTFQGAAQNKSSRKRTASTPAPSTPPAKRTKYDQDIMDDFVVEGTTASQHHPTTMAPPRRVRDPPSPCVEATQSRRNSADFRTQTALSETDDTIQYVAEELATIVPHPTPSRNLGVSASGASLNKGHTPQHQLVEHEHVFGLANVEILSSNSKPLPGHPVAESVAISGHADRMEVDIEMEMGEYETAKSNPFLQRFPSQKAASFVRRLTGDSQEANDVDTSPSLSRAKPLERSRRDRPSTHLAAAVTSAQPTVNPKALAKVHQVNEHSKDSYPKRTSSPKRVTKFVDAGYTTPIQKRGSAAPRKAVEAAVQSHPHPVLDADIDVDVDGDQTLVADADDFPPLPKPSPVNFRSSPPVAHLTSSNHSSTSADSTPPSERASSIPTEDVEDAEWEESLQPHQRALGDQLHRISKRVLRHIVDHETAVDDIAVMYAEDGEHLLNKYVERHSGEYEKLEKGVEKKKAEMRNELLGVAKNIAKERQRYKSAGRGV